VLGNLGGSIRPAHREIGRTRRLDETLRDDRQHLIADRCPMVSLIFLKPSRSIERSANGR
jgi:hypothetical protein